MSHFTTIKTQIKDANILKQALSDMGYTVKSGRQKIRGYQGNTHYADFVIKMAEGYDIGLVKNASGAFDIVADWWGVKNATQASFTQNLQEKVQIIQEEIDREIRRQYAIKKVLEEVKKHGFNVIQQEESESKEVKILVRRYA